ncbi:MAG: phage late control D family protein [Planctomycetes bacterium]|nr:phage late control D family protein [Planctomycetota bacterium]
MSQVSALHARSRQPGGLYAPVFAVAVGGRDLRRDVKLDLLSVNVDLSLESASRATFVLGDLFRLGARKFKESLDPVQGLFHLGAEVAVRVGYGSVASASLVFVGIVTELTTSFDAQTVPQVTVAALDYSYPMSKRVRSHTWNDARHSDVVGSVAGEYGLGADVVETQPKVPKIEQNQESDLDFLRRLARRNEFIVYAQGKKLRFAPPRLQGNAALTLRWGEALLSFAPEINLAEQVGKVEVHGWDVDGKREIVGRAGVGDDRGTRGTTATGPALVAQLLKDSTLSVRRPVHSQQEADEIAKALLHRRAERLVRGSGATPGLPELGVDQLVEIEGLGAPFSGIYYVEQLTHSVSASGFSTSFKVRSPAL